MKRWAAMALALVFICGAGLLAGCKRSNIADNFGDAVIEWKENEGQKQSDTIIVPFPDGDVADSLGFQVVSYPDTNALRADRFFAIENWFVQIQYKTPDDRDLVVRIAREDEPDLKSTYSESHGAEGVDETIAGVGVHIGVDEKGCTLVSWTKGGYQYILHSNERQNPPGEDEISALVSGLLCRDAQDASSSG